MKTKPLIISGLNQNQRNRYVRCAGYSGQKLNDWVSSVLDAAAEQVLHFENTQLETVVSPTWLAGLSTRSAACLMRANYSDITSLKQDWENKPKAFFYSMPNFGNKTYSEIDEWLNQQNPN